MVVVAARQQHSGGVGNAAVAAWQRQRGGISNAGAMAKGLAGNKEGKGEGGKGDDDGNEGGGRRRGPW